MTAKPNRLPAMLLCAIGTLTFCPAYSQPSSPYHPPHIGTWRELQQKLGNEAPDDALVVQLSTPEGAGLSTVALGGQDVQTSTAQVHVAPGRRPLYLVAGSTGAMIWRFTGATNRIRRLVLSGETGIPGKDYDPMPLAGETGVDEARVFTVRRRNCLLGFDGRDSAAAKAAADFVHHQSGRKVDIQVAARRASIFQVPSSVVRETPRPFPSVRHILGLEKPDLELQYQVGYRWPDGVIRLAAGRVVSTRHAEPYRVLPGAAGLQQLVRSGALTQLSADEYAVKRPFVFPAGISGSGLPRFLLDRKYGTSASCHFTRDNRSNRYDGVACD